MNGLNGMNVHSVARTILRVALQNLTQPNSTIPVIRGVGNRPFQNKAGIIKLCIVGFGSLYAGGFIAQKGASYLEEKDLFVPSNEDDED